MRALSWIMLGVLAGIGGTLGPQQVFDDVATYRQLVADDAEFGSPFGGVADKETRVAQIRGGAVAPTRVVFRDRPGYRVRRYGDTAVLSWQHPATAERSGQRVVRVFVSQRGS